MVVAYGWDSDGTIHASRHNHACPLRSRPCERQVPSVDHQVPLPADSRIGLAAFRRWGITVPVVGIFLRTVVGLHATWLVNSVTHMWGSRRFSTRDGSTNNWFVALLTFGEGWHDNHHAHPTFARHGLKWYEIDMNWYGIWMLRVFGLATQIKRVEVAELIRKGIRSDLPHSSVRQLQSSAGD
jgi:hypothetical protein